MSQTHNENIEGYLFEWPLPIEIIEHLGIEGVNSHIAISADITNDGTDELILHFSSNNVGKVASSPLETRDSIVVFDFLQTGEVKVINKQIFGQNLVVLGAGSRDYDVGDLNGDGYVDIALALNGDDGRTLLENQDIDSPLAYGKNSAVLLSSETGAYSVQFLPQVQFWHTVNIIPNSIGVDSVVLSDSKLTTEQDATAFTLVDSNFEYQDEFPYIHNNSAAYTEGRSLSEKDYIVATTYPDNDGNRPSLSAYARADATWENIDNIEFKSAPIELVRQLNSIFGYPDDKMWFEFSGFYVVDFVIWEVASLSAPNTKNLYLAQASGGFVSVANYYDHNSPPDLLFGSLWSTFKIDEGSLIEVDAINEDQNIEATSFHYQVIDINLDGYEDFIVWEEYSDAYSLRSGRSDLGFNVYLNKAGEALTLLPQVEQYDVTVSDYSLPRGIFLDVDGDAELDVVRFSQNLYSFPDEGIFDQAPILHLAAISEFSDLDAGSELIVVKGGAEPDYILGTASADVLYGFASDDTLLGLAGNDLLNGGSGLDRAVYSGSQDCYIVKLSRTVTTIEDRRSDGDGTDILSSIEFLDFDTGLVGSPFNLQKFGGASGLTKQDLESFIEFYIAYFNRAPDAVGLNFWGTAYAQGTTLEDMARLFVDQDETRATYPEATSNLDFATSVYSNVLGRTPDQAGIDFWVGQLDAGNVTRDQFILAVLRGAKSDLKPELGQAFVDQQLVDKAYLDNKVDIGAYFAVHKGMSDVENARDVMALYDGTQTSIDVAVDATDALYDAAVDPSSGEFLIQIIGVLDDPFIA